MKPIAIIVDAACDLPASFIQQNNIFVIPFNIFTNDGCVKDDALPQSKLRLYKSHIVNKSLDFARTDVLLENEIENFFLDHIVFNFDSAIFITVSASRSDMFKTMHSAWKNMSIKCFQLRRQRGLTAPFNLQMINSGSMGPGQGLLTYAAVQAVKNGRDINDAIKIVKALRTKIFTYAIANDLLYAYTRAKQKNENSITWSKYALASALNLKPIMHFYAGESTTVGRGRGFEGALSKVIAHLKLKLKEGIEINQINVSYSGDLKDIEESNDYLTLVGAAKTYGVEVMLSHMSATLAVNIGEKAIMLAFCAESSRFNE